MYNYSPNIIVDVNDRLIKFKRSEIHYRVNAEMITKLIEWYDTDFEKFDSLNEKCKYLINEGIVIKSSFKYNPFVKKNVVNRAFVQLTNKCNLRCKHCYASGSILNNGALDLEGLKQFLKILINNGVSKIDFTGGEIFTYPYIWNLLAWLNNYPVQSVLFTNLTLLDKAEIERLSSFSCITKIVTSLDYYSPEKHNEFRQGFQAYEKTTKAIQLISKTDIKVSVNIMVMNDNHKEVFKLIKTLRNYKDVNFVLDTLLYEGRATKFNYDEYDRKKNCLMCCSLNDNVHKFSDIVPHPYDDNFKGINCGVAKDLIFVAYNGDITLCPSLPDFKMEKNIYELEKFDEICKFLGRFSYIKCKYIDCRKYKECCDGCRARAYINTGNILEKDIESCYKFGVE